MKIKAVVLSLVLLAPTAGAAAAQVESASAFRVQTGKAPATPAQDFRVSYAKTAVSTTPTIFAKSNLPKALSDAELDEVKGELLWFAPAVPVIGEVVVTTVARIAAGAALGAILTSDSAQQKPLTSGDIRKLKENDIDPHELKQSGSGGRVSDKDLYKDRDGNVYVKPKGGKGPGEPTGVNLKDLP
ncbi:polymorphic toxin type 33 domain-containing protein [Deinococcus sp. RL]|uniref:polymorphic toxin type 33 domain-containing protein n=1 Tax=Deinococcus sp. RL TaxID=1489678 RepID=UPI0009DCB09A|nr:polymorphic toxin type 33 domain-containing protein [Deinococcus sp. RL]